MPIRGCELYFSLCKPLKRASINRRLIRRVAETINPKTSLGAGGVCRDRVVTSHAMGKVQDPILREAWAHRIPLSH